MSIIKKQVIIDDSYRNQKPRIYEETAPCIRAEREGLKVAEVKVIGTLNETFESQGRVYDKEGPSPTLRCFQGGGLQPKIVEEPHCIGGIGERKSNGGSQYYQQDRVYKGDISMCHPANLSCGSYNYIVPENDGRAECGGEKPKYRIRKLTPRECWRLMGYSDSDFDRASRVNSNSQLYKQAGNAIVKQVLMAIFSQLNIPGVKPWNSESD